jgi:hypothetical protein
MPSVVRALDDEYDVVVVGGGSAGVAAAVSAARQGARTLLVEKFGFLGGVMTATTLGGVCGFFSLVNDEPHQMVFGFADEVKKELERRGGTPGPLKWLKTASFPYDIFTLKKIFDDFANIPNLSLALQTSLISAEHEDGWIRSIELATRGQLWSVRAANFVDATGDALLCHFAGAETELDIDNLQFPTTMFRMGGVDTAKMQRITRPEMHRLLERAIEDGFDIPRTAGGIYAVGAGVVHLNITKIAIDGRPPNPFDAAEISHAERAGREQVITYLNVFRRYVPGFEHAFIIDSGAELGLRETRRIVGDYVLTFDDVAEERKFADAIACNCWPVEEHGTGRSIRWVWLRPGGYNHIPYRALIPVSLRNVLVAGKCVSASHEAQAAIRVTANCFSMGQAAGVACALANDDGVRSIDIAQLQSELGNRGVVLNPDSYVRSKNGKTHAQETTQQL